MQPYHSDAKVVKGLGIATLVLSILSIVLLALCLAFAGAVTDYAVKAVSSSTTAQDVIEQSESISDSFDDLNDALDLFTTINADDAALVFDNASLDEVHALGKALKSADMAKVEKQLEKINKEYSLGIDTDAMIAVLGAASTTVQKEFGSYLLDLDAQDLDELISSFASFDSPDIAQDVTQINDALKTGEGRAALTNGIGTLIMVLIGLGMAANVITIITSALAIANCRKPEKLTAAFVLSIVSAVLSLITTSFISLVLYIVMAVYIAKVRKYRSVAGAAPASGPDGSAPVYPN